MHGVDHIKDRHWADCHPRPDVEEKEIGREVGRV